MCASVESTLASVESTLAGVDAVSGIIAVVVD